MNHLFRRASRHFAALVGLATAACAPATVAPPRAALPGEQSDSGSRDVIYYAQAAQAAARAGDYAESLRLALQVRALAPSHPGAHYLLARAYALTGRPDSAVALLERVARMGDAHAIDTDSAFRALRDSPSFRKVAAEFAANRRPIERSSVAFEVPGPDLLPEAMAYDAADGAFFVGSLSKHKVVRVSREGSVRDFAGPADDIMRVVGVKLDAARGRLWFASWAPGLDSARAPARRVDHTRLFVYDAHTGVRLVTLSPRDSLRAHLFNDLAITRDGDVYITDTGSDAVYRVRAGGADTLELFVRPGPAQFTGPNGIALSGDERRLYVAFVEGIAVVDLETRATRYLTTPPEVATGNVDGLAWFDGSLVAVQTIPTLERIVRFELDAAGCG